MRIVCLTAVYQRPEITELFYQGFAHQQKIAASSGIELGLCVVASNDDDAALARKYSHEPIMSQNLPLGAKHNAGLAHIMSKDFHYMMQLGSDDILTDSFFKLEEVIDALKNEIPVFGLNELIFLELSTMRAKRVSTLRPFGAGRFIHKSMLDGAVVCKPIRWRNGYAGINYQRGKGHIENYPASMIKSQLHDLLSDEVVIQLWEPSINSGLDYNSESRLIFVHGMKKARCRVLPLKDAIIDLKSSVNIHKYKALEGKEMSTHELARLGESFSVLK